VNNGVQKCLIKAAPLLLRTYVPSSHLGFLSSPSHRILFVVFHPNPFSKIGSQVVEADLELLVLLLPTPGCYARMITRMRHHPWLKSSSFEDRTFPSPPPNWRDITYKYVLGSTQHKTPRFMGLPGPISESPGGHIWKRANLQDLLSSASASLLAQVCARGRSPAAHSPRVAARWRHGRGSVCRFGPLQIRVCGKRGGAETRPGRGEDGPARQTDRGPGGRRAAHCSHVPPWIRRQPGPGLPTCPPGGSSSWRQGRARDPGQSGPRAPATSGASSGVGARVAAGVWGSKCLP
jgi:hypothetical protein